LYEYQCASCGRFEVIQKFSDAALSACPTCGAEVQKLLSAPAIQFKGTGWYITDYARKSGGGEAKTAPKEGKTEGAPSSTSSTSDSASSSPTPSTSKDSSASGSSSTK
jgi:putative FmdB family regulatory protein